MGVVVRRRGRNDEGREVNEMLRISQIRLEKDEPVSRIPAKIGQKLGLKHFQPKKWKIVKESIDAREKPRIRFIYTVDFEVDEEESLLERASRRKGVHLTRADEVSYQAPAYAAADPQCHADRPERRAENPRSHAALPEHCAEGREYHVADPEHCAAHPGEEAEEGPETGGGNASPRLRPVVVGFGPCGMFAALILAEAGLRPLVLERGRDADRRAADVERFWSTGELDPESNVQFGEGGAGTFSDGKLTTGIRDPRIGKVKAELIEAGADPAIAYRQMPHVGTDVLREVVKKIRKKIISLGGEVRFESRLTGLRLETVRKRASGVENEKKAEEKEEQTERSLPTRELIGIMVNGCELISCRDAVLAVGNSARDTFRMLLESGVKMEAKPFSVGVRIEHPQSMINFSQYGMEPNDAEGRMGAAAYKLSGRASSGRGVYTFCMCPGGYVVGAASREGGIVTNGMSYHDRAGKNANSALLVDVGPADFAGARENPLAGVDFQEELERMAYEAGGGSYFAPAERLGDFLAKASGGNVKDSDSLSGVRPTYRPGITWTDLSECLPDFVAEAMREVVPEMGKKIRGFDMEDAVLTGVETRSSSPVRISRGESLDSLTAAGLYPGGEGAGYAGGIMSAAVDGIRIAEKIIERCNAAVDEYSL